MTSRRFVQAELNKWLSRLRLQRWEVALVTYPARHIPGTDDHLGHLECNEEQLTATVSIALDHDEADVAATVLHEVLHLLLDPVCQQFRMASQALGPQARDLAEAEFVTPVENVVATLERALTGVKELTDNATGH